MGGPLREAPTLFIGSNPNIRGREHYPGTDASDEELIDFFDLAFEGEHPQIKKGTRRRREGSESTTPD